MTSSAASSAGGAHAATYLPLETGAGASFECQVTCSCGDFERTSSSGKGATQARANARAAFNRHLHKVEDPAPAPVQDPGPAPSQEPEQEPEAEPEAELASLSPAPSTTNRAGRVLAAVVLAAVVAILSVLVVSTVQDRSTAPDSAAPLGGASPSGPPIGSLPPLPIQRVKGPPKAAFVDLLRRADPVFDTFGGNELEQGGRVICRDYGRGNGVVEISSTILASSTLDSVQAITMIAAAGRTLCPSYADGIGSEVSGLG